MNILYLLELLKEIKVHILYLLEVLKVYKSSHFVPFSVTNGT